MAERNRKRNSGRGTHEQEGIHGESARRGDEMSGSKGHQEEPMHGSARSGVRHGVKPQDRTSGSREESMEDIDERGSMRGSGSGTTGLGGERNRSSGSPGGVEGYSEPGSPDDGHGGRQ